MDNDSVKIAGESPLDYLYSLTDNYGSLTKSEKIIADCLLADKMLFASCTITMLSRKLGVSPASITRFCQKLNYSGFSGLKHNIVNGTLTPLKAEDKLSVNDSVGNIISKLGYLGQTALLDTLKHLNLNLINATVKALCNARTIHIYAEGGPGVAASYAYQQFLKLGFFCNYFIDTQLAMIGAVQLKSRDVCICISRTGYSKSMLRAVDLAKKSGATIIGITASDDSDLVDMSDIILRYSPRIENDLRYLHIARICELSVIGVLFAAIANSLPEQTSQSAANSARALQLNSQPKVKKANRLPKSDEETR